jgi:hypothetical protein
MHPTNFSMLALALTASMAPTVPLPSVYPSRPSRRRSRGPAPIVWSNQRELLTLVQRFRAAVLRSAVDAQTSNPADEVLAWYARSLALADAYIERLERAIDERPQGKGGWQVVSQLEKMYAEFAAHHDNPPAGMAVEVEPRTMYAADPSVSETLFSKD